MWFRDLFKRHGTHGKNEKTDAQEPTINQGIFYLYSIIIAQVVFVLVLASIMMVVGKVMATPLWVFLMTVLVCGAGIVYIYRKAKRQFQKFRDSFGRVELSDRNYEISFMGGVVTMKIEHAQHPMLEQPQRPAALLDAETIDAGPAHHPDAS